MFSEHAPQKSSKHPKIYSLINYNDGTNAPGCHLAAAKRHKDDLTFRTRSNNTRRSVTKGRRRSEHVSAFFGPVHTETFSCVFVLFQVMSWLFTIPLRTVENTKTQENVSACTGPLFHSVFLK